MSLIVTVYVPTGIVMSGDSRMTVSIAGVPPIHLVGSDATEKVFIVHKRFGISTFGDALVNNLPIAHYINQFETITQVPPTTRDCADELKKFFCNLSPVPATHFHVAGYDNNHAFVFYVDLQKGSLTHSNIPPTGPYGVQYGGDISITQRLLSQNLPLFNVMNIQDAVDYSRHLIRSTIDQMRFEPRQPTVGGPIDTIVILDGSTYFLAKKELKFTN